MVFKTCFQEVWHHAGSEFTRRSVFQPETIHSCCRLRPIVWTMAPRATVDQLPKACAEFKLLLEKNGGLTLENVNNKKFAMEKNKAMSSMRHAMKTLHTDKLKDYDHDNYTASLDNETRPRASKNRACPDKRGCRSLAVEYFTCEFLVVIVV